MLITRTSRIIAYALCLILFTATAAHAGPFGKLVAEGKTAEASGGNSSPRI